MPGQGGDGGLVLRLLLQEAKLVRRQSSAWRKSFLLWAVVSEEGSLFLSVPALLAQVVSGSFTPVLDVRVHVPWLGVCSGRGCCLLSLLLRADSLPAFVTHLKPSCFL